MASGKRRPPVPKPSSSKKKDTTRKQINKLNRDRGKATERSVAKLTGGKRVPGSGAFKQGPSDLTGDVLVNDAADSPMLKIEVKGTARLTPKGEKTFTIHKKVLDQAVQEAEAVGVVGLVFLHWIHAQYEKDDFVIFKVEHFLRFLEWAKIGAAIENGRIDVDLETPDE